MCSQAPNVQSESWEEERLPFYRPEQFYPVHIGELLNSKYRVVGKLGYGSYSTVWLCHEKSEKKYVAVKVLTNSLPERTLSGELGIYEHLSNLKTSHTGSAYIRGLEANVVHTDIKATNIMLSIDDKSILEDFEKAEQQSPSPKKVVDENRTIYTSRRLRLPNDNLWGQPVLCDLGQARIGHAHRGLIQPDIYRAPEVLFDMGWGHSADIWNLGVMAWDIFEGRHLFSALDEDQEYSPSHHVAEMVAFLGLPPLSFIQRSEETRHVFSEKGEWLGAGGVTIPDTSLERLEEYLSGNGQQSFLQFIRSMLQWIPGNRKTAKELLNDSWLNS
ncbi:hypothetical protein AKAW_11146 [Aspergillus luchuensis IFO 4308]|nr:hypothetical protein AKAW_11146 [Aspergillus luchuensis IFO 4308]